MKLRTNLEISSFTGFGDIIEGMPKILAAILTLPTPLLEISYFHIAEMTKLKRCTKFEVSSFIGFQVIVQIMPNILGVTDLCHAPFQKYCTLDRWEGLS